MQESNSLIVRMKRTAIIISAIIAAAVAAWAVRQAVAGRRPTFDTHRMEKADKAVLRAIDDGQTAGAVLCVVKRADDGESMGEILYLKAYGNMQVCSGCDAVSGELNADTVAMPVDAVFDLASVSKCLGTTLAFMRLVEDGLVRLDDNVSRYIPGFEPWVEDLSPKEQRRQKRKPERIPITVKQLLTHTSGLPAAIHVPTFMARYDEYRDTVGINYRDSLVAYLAHDAARLSKPGEVFRYSCLNFITLQAILERVTGERLDRYAAREIFRPLRLKNTWYNALDDDERPYGPDTPIVPTEVQEDGTLLRGEVHDPTARIVNRGVSGNAGLFSTAEDMAVMASMLMNGGVVSLPADGVAGKLGKRERVRVLSRRAVETFFTVPEGYEQFGRALGWDVGSPYASGNGDLFTPRRTVNHTGYTGPSIVIDLDEGIAVILLANRVHPYDTGNIGRLRIEIADIVASALE